MMGNVWISKDDPAPSSPRETLYHKIVKFAQNKNNHRIIIDKTTK